MAVVKLVLRVLGPRPKLIKAVAGSEVRNSGHGFRTDPDGSRIDLDMRFIPSGDFGVNR